MNLYHYPIIHKLRNFARQCGLLTVLKKAAKPTTYEDAFHNAMQATIQPGDIGANIGYYTTKFAEWSGASEKGHVFAFEPLPPAIQQLRSAVQDLPTSSASVTICEVAISDATKTASFEVVGGAGGPGLTTVGRISEGRVEESNSKTHVQVQVETVDRMCKREGMQGPNVTKIDVEGFEEEVLQGGTETFSSNQSRHLFIEMHFTRMDERGMLHREW